MITKTVYFLLLLPSIVLGQQQSMSVKSIFANTNKVYEKADYLSILSTYTTYDNYTTKEVSESYTGEILKKNNVTYYRIKDFDFLIFNDYSLKISNAEKAIVISKNTKRNSSPISLENYTKGFDTKIIPDSRYWICELTPKKVSQIMMNKVVIYINKSDYSIAKQELYMLQQAPYKNAKGKIVSDTPRISIVFKARQKQEAKDNLLVDKKQYFTESGKNIILAKKYSTYKLFHS